MRRSQRWTNVFVSSLTVASSLAVLVSDVVVPGYREHYGDSSLFVAAYTALQIWFLVVFWRGSREMTWVAIAKLVGALAFLATFTVIGPAWMAVTPSRYIYLLFDWGQSTKIGMFAFVFVGRGAWNAFNAFMATEEWWRPLRKTHPLLGRLLTAVPVVIIVGCVWAFLTLVQLDAKTFSPDAAEVARIVLADTDCTTIRSRDGTTTNDVRQRGTATYKVEVRWGCRMTQVVVTAEDGRLGTASAPRPECCADRAAAARS
jgi:hypothetical protein